VVQVVQVVQVVLAVLVVLAQAMELAPIAHAPVSSYAAVMHSSARAQHSYHDEACFEAAVSPLMMTTHFDAADGGNASKSCWNYEWHHVCDDVVFLCRMLMLPKLAWSPAFL
jgi:hypothetical protein